MTDEATQATAENLRADFLNAITTAERWKVLNRAIDWAVAASENPDHYRQQAQSKEHTVNLKLDSADVVERVRAQLAAGGLARGPGVSALVGEKVEGEERQIRPGDVVRHSDYGAGDGDDPWVVLSLVEGTKLVEVAPLRDDYALHCFLLHTSHLKK